MLKNKKSIYVLIPLNLLIWGYFGFKIYGAFSETELRPNSIQRKTVAMVLSSDTLMYRLNLNYEDPFLKVVNRARLSFNHTESSMRINHGQKQGLVEPAKTMEQKKLPDIKYIGLIKNNTTGISRAIVALNGQSVLVKKGETTDGFTFKSFNKDSLVVKWEKEFIVIHK